MSTLFKAGRLLTFPTKRVDAYSNKYGIHTLPTRPGSADETKATIPVHELAKNASVAQTKARPTRAGSALFVQFSVYKTKFKFVALPVTLHCCLSLHRINLSPALSAKQNKIS